MSLPCLAAVVLLAAPSLARPPQDEPAAPRITTRWAEGVGPENVHREYPRPQMTRPAWLCLNGSWSWAVRPRTDARPTEWDGEILVPFAIESALSGVGRHVGPDERLWYRRSVQLPADWNAQRLLLHFGAVDWEARVWVNGSAVGVHRGGYDPFTFDVTAAVGKAATVEVVVAVWDPTDTEDQPRGKQVQRPHGIWYTPVTGIWQTVWLEPVPQVAVERLEIVPDLARGRLSVAVHAPGLGELQAVEVEARLGERVVGSARAVGGRDGARLDVVLTEKHPWSPADPTLYDLTVRLLGAETGGERPVLDEVGSYAGLRDVRVLPDLADGVPRIHLNGQPLFQLGPLDQGYWPDGLYTAPSDQALSFDLETVKRVGFNMVRKHVKVEPARWYWHADRLGVLVWQDLPSGGPFIGPGDPDAERSPLSAWQYERELAAMVDALASHPCIVVWVPFNEGWGQFDTERIAGWLAERDPSRLVDATSGWADRGVGDLHDVHVYPGPGMSAPEAERAVVLGEFGGLGLPVAEHTWQAEENWGYRSYATRAELAGAYEGLLRDLRPLVARGLSAAVYTQLTDVEIEVNGLLTYDRAVLKIDEARLAELNATVQGPPPRLRALLPTAQREPQDWRWTTTAPPAGWERPGFDDSGWALGPAGFGTEGTPGAVVRTVWDTSDLWLRRTFTIDGAVDAGALWLHVHHDEDAEVYLNGLLAARLEGYTSAYRFTRLDPGAAASLAPGENTIAVHVRQTRGGQYFDAGLVELVERE